MLELIATKKGLTAAAPGQKKTGKKAKQVPNVDEAARRMIRDFLGNRLRFYSKIWLIN